MHGDKPTTAGSATIIVKLVTWNTVFQVRNGLKRDRRKNQYKISNSEKKIPEIEEFD